MPTQTTTSAPLSPRILAAVALLAPAAAQEAERFGDEGPLRNDTFLPTSEDAQRELTAGDRAWRRSRSSGGAAASDRTSAYDAWRRALESSENGDAVLCADVAAGEPLWPDPDHTHHRRSEGVAYAILRRLSAATPGERAEWRDRFAPGAADSLAEARFHGPSLERLERLAPLTEGAAVAALRLADLALEEGRIVAAELWLERAGRHATAQAEPGELERAIAQRSGAIASLRTAEVDPSAGAEWRSAVDADFLRATRLESSGRTTSRAHTAPLGRTLDPGLCVLDDGAVVVQTPRALVYADATAMATRQGGTIARHPLTELLGIPSIRPFASPSTGGWPLDPATDGRRVVVVVDRGRPGRVVRDFPLPAKGNLLACVQYGPLAVPKLDWVYREGALRVPGEAPVPGEEILGPGTWEFQPGPLVSEGVLYVQARALSDPGEGAQGGDGIWLFALDLQTARPLWRRFLTRAADLRADLGGRLGTANELPTAGMPLALVNGRVIVGTNVGLVVAVDAVDGRLAWTLRNARRRAEDEGWPGSRAPVATDGGGADPRTAVLVAPFDADVLYALPAGPDLGRGLFVAPPLALGTTEGLVDGELGRIVAQGRDGRHRALRTWTLEAGWRSALYLGEQERFGGKALASPERVWLASDRSLYLFDRTRDLTLLGAPTIPDKGAGRGGSVHGVGASLLVLGADTLWMYRVR